MNHRVSGIRARDVSRDSHQWWEPALAVMAILFVGVTFHHTASGIQVVLEDYVHHEPAKLASIIVEKFVCFALAVAGIFAVLKIAFGG